MQGGVEYRIRPIRPDDAERERAFIHEPVARVALPALHVHAARAVRGVRRAVWSNVDQHRDMALVAVIGEGADEKIIGVARYAADADGRDCEFAVAVADEWQCRGIGTTLTKLLFEYAAREGFRTIYGTVLANNQRMIELAQWLGLTVEPPVAGQATVRAWRRRLNRSEARSTFRGAGARQSSRARAPPATPRRPRDTVPGL